MRKIILSGSEFEDVNYEELINFIKGYGFETEKEEDLLLRVNPDSFAEKMAKIRVLNPDKKELNENPFPIEKGYLLQAIYFYKCLLKGKKFKFCKNRNCALFNSHWQKDILKAQMEHKLCKIHSREFII